MVKSACNAPCFFRSSTMPQPDFLSSPYDVYFCWNVFCWLRIIGPCGAALHLGCSSFSSCYGPLFRRPWAGYHPLRRVQPGARYKPCECGERGAGPAGCRRQPHQDRELRQRKAVLHAGKRRMLAAKPPGPSCRTALNQEKFRSVGASIGGWSPLVLRKTSLRERRTTMSRPPSSFFAKSGQNSKDFLSNQ